MLLAILLASAGCQEGVPPLDPDGEPNALPRVRLVGVLQDLLAHLPGRESNGYVPPTTDEREHFRLAVSRVEEGGVAAAESILEPFDYAVQRVVEEESGDTLVVIREQAPIRRGWGTYIFNPSSRAPIDIHANHPFSDLGSLETAGELYRRCGCRWFLIAGTHRNANPSQEADMARSVSSVFQDLYEQVADGASLSLSIHSFLPSAHGPPIDRTEIILSNGANRSGVVRATDSVRALRAQLAARSWAVGLAGDDPGFSALNGAINPQGRYANSRFGHGRWIHVEVSVFLAVVPTVRESIAAAIAEWLPSHAVP